MTAITKTEATPLATTGAADLLRTLTERGELNKIDVDKLAKIQEMIYRDQDRAAKSEYAASLSRFQEECPPIPKSHNVDQTTKSGARICFDYANLQDIEKTVRPVLNKYGFSFSYANVQAPQGHVAQSCTLRHIAGHSETCESPPIPVESPNPQMSAQHKAIGASTTARRLALIAVTGVTICDPEIGEEKSVLEPITHDQVIEIEDLIKATNADTKAFCRVYGIASVSALPQHLYQAARRMLEAKRT